MNILICDDDSHLASLIAEGLRLDGHCVTVTCRVEEAIDASGTVAFDAALLDIDLPLVDGWALASRLRASPGGSLVRMVALSARCSPRDIARSSDAGFDLHLCKPASLARIEAALRAPPPRSHGPKSRCEAGSRT